MTTLSETLESISACREACAWVAGFTDAQVAWDACDRGDWMLWLIGKLSGRPGSDSRKAIVRVACECAKTSLALFESRHPDDKQPRIAIETAERHCDGGATISEVKNAASAAYAADAAYAAYAAYASAASAAASAASAASRKKRLKECADIVRKHFPKAPSIPPEDSNQQKKPSTRRAKVKRT